MTKLTQFLHEQITEQGLKRPDLAKNLGVSYATLNVVLRDAGKPKYKFCLGVAKYFNIPLSEVLEMTEDPKLVGANKAIPKFHLPSYTDPYPNLTDFGKWFRKLLKDSNMTQQEFSEKVNGFVTQKAVSAIARGYGQPGINALIAINIALDIPLDFLFKKAGKKNTNSAELKALAAQLGSLNEDDRKHIEFLMSRLTQ